MKLKSKHLLLVVVGMGSLSLCASDTKISTEVKAVEKTSVAVTEVADTKVSDAPKQTVKKQTANTADKTKQTIKVSDIAGKTDLKITFVESFDTMRKCELGGECGKKLQETRSQLAKSIQEDEQRIAKLEAEFQAKASTLSAMAREKDEKQLRKLKADYTTKLQESEYEMKLAMQASTEELARDMEAAVQRIAKKNNFDAVVDTVTGRVLYVKDELNITSEVIKEMNTDYQVKLAKAKNPEVTTKLAANTKAPVKAVATTVDTNKPAVKA